MLLTILIFKKMLVGEVEADETYIGGDYINKHERKKLEGSKDHLQKYIEEFTFRFNTRHNSTRQRFDLILCNVMAG